MAEKVIVVSNTSGEVQIDLPELRLKRVWTKKGAKLPIELEYFLKYRLKKYLHLELSEQAFFGHNHKALFHTGSYCNCPE